MDTCTDVYASMMIKCIKMSKSSRIKSNNFTISSNTVHRATCSNLAERLLQ